MTSKTSAETRPRPTESPPETSTEPAVLPLDVVYEILSNQRRRWALRYLHENPQATTLGELAEHIASLENDKPIQSLSSQERKRVYICCYQAHLPKMDEANVVDFDPDRKTISTGPNFHRVMSVLPADRDHGTRRTHASFWEGVKSAGRRIVARLLERSR